MEDKYIIELALDDDENAKYRNPIKLGQYLRSLLVDKDETYYIFLDEIQKVATINNPYIDDKDEKISFVDVVLGLMKKNTDIYITGSNSKMLSSEILTEFRGRGDEIRVHSLSFKEFYDAYEGDKNDAWLEYYTYGGMPFVSTLKSYTEKSQYLSNLFNVVYLSDILDKHYLKEKEVLDELLNVVSSSIGSLSNPQKISDTFASVSKIKTSRDSISRYLDYFIDAFMISKAQRYDIKGRKYIGSPQKYYFEDIGLRNVRLNFRQTEETHIMENIIYNELIARGFSVDLGGGRNIYNDISKKNKKTNLEVDFVVTDGLKKYYIQSALSVSEEEKRFQEVRPYSLINDSFKKIVIVKDNIIPWYDENGVLYIGIVKFLLDDNCMNY